MTNQQPSTVPAWLNLDAVVPVALRERLNGAAEAIDAWLPTLSGLCEEAYAAREEYEAATQAAGVSADDLFAAVDEVSGAALLFNALSQAETLIRCGGGDPPADPDTLPNWYREAGLAAVMTALNTDESDPVVKRPRIILD
jgi:hypothetical protein